MNIHHDVRPISPEVLIAPLDGSQMSERSVPLLTRCALNLRIPVRVLHVFDSIRKLRRYASSDIYWSEDADPRALVNAPAWMQDVVDDMKSAGVQVEIVGRVGNPSDEILKEIARDESAWTIMCSLGSTGARKLFLGSTARNVLRSASDPVVIVPAHVPSQAVDDSAGSRKVTVLLDGTQQSESSIPHAAAMAEGCGVTLEFVRVAETYRNDNGNVIDGRAWEQQAREAVAYYLDQVARTWSTLSVPVTTVVLAGHPVTQICRHVTETQPLHVALATRRRSGIERWTYGSVAEKIADRVSIPLMLVPVDFVE